MVTWRLDTCSCKVVIRKVNPDDPLDDNWTVEQVLNICPIHVDEATNAELLSALLRENRRVQGVREVLLNNAPATMVMTNTSGHLIFRENIILTWSWSGTKPNRVLTLRLQGHTLTANQRNSVQAKINERYPGLTINFVNN